MLHSYSMYTTCFTVKTINAFSLLFVSITHYIFNSELLESVGNHFIMFFLFILFYKPQNDTKGFFIFLLYIHLLVGPLPESKTKKKKEICGMFQRNLKSDRMLRSEEF